jgi:hypothetical protein
LQIFFSGAAAGAAFGCEEELPGASAALFSANFAPVAGLLWADAAIGEITSAAVTIKRPQKVFVMAQTPLFWRRYKFSAKGVFERSARCRLADSPSRLIEAFSTNGVCR